MVVGFYYCHPIYDHYLDIELNFLLKISTSVIKIKSLTIERKKIPNNLMNVHFINNCELSFIHKKIVIYIY